jgi:DNA transposition AAA+ family ATPase
VSRPEEKTEEWNKDGFGQLRAQVRAFLQSRGLSQTKASKNFGAEATFAHWLKGTYAGDAAAVADRITRWMERYDREGALAEAAGQAPDFVMTASAERFQRAFRIAQALPDMAAVTGAPGIGKTTAARQYQASTSNVLMITAHQSNGKPNTILAALAKAMRIEERNSAKLFEAVGERLKDSRALIIVDEAQHLGLAALEQMRALHDLYAVGLAFVGNDLVSEKLNSGVTMQPRAQLSSRFGYRLIQQRVRREDIETLLDAWGLLDGPERGFAREVAAKPGALRSLTKMMQLAAMLAGGGAVSVETMRQAWEKQHYREIRAAEIAA